MAKMVLKKVGILSFAKIYTILMAIAGLIVGIIFTVIAFLVQAFAAATSGEAVPGFVALGAANIVIMPIVYAIIGFVSGVIMAWLYNVIANLVGGVELELE